MVLLLNGDANRNDMFAISVAKGLGTDFRVGKEWG